jgi:hypothetical protein
MFGLGFVWFGMVRWVLMGGEGNWSRRRNESAEPTGFYTMALSPLATAHIHSVPLPSVPSSAGMGQLLSEELCLELTSWAPRELSGWVLGREVFLGPRGGSPP